ncbi:MAG: hypothetical protein HFF28_02450 [Oscillospiraceae bacterium]|nr:hypothetical protein [Oscillospiraceae bacterium]
MQVIYNGFTGELVKLERKEAVITFDPFVRHGAAKLGAEAIGTASDSHYQRNRTPNQGVLGAAGSYHL